MKNAAATYGERVAAFLEGHGFLKAAQDEALATNASYIRRAEEEGMSPIRCANNIAKRWSEGR